MRQTALLSGRDVVAADELEPALMDPEPSAPQTCGLERRQPFIQASAADACRRGHTNKCRGR